jgi:phosphate transport system ATP-binding protein
MTRTKPKSAKKKTLPEPAISAPQLSASSIKLVAEQMAALAAALNAALAEQSSAVDEDEVAEELEQDSSAEVEGDELEEPRTGWWAATLALPGLALSRLRGIGSGSREETPEPAMDVSRLPDGAEESDPASDSATVTEELEVILTGELSATLAERAGAGPESLVDPVSPAEPAPTGWRASALALPTMAFTRARALLPWTRERSGEAATGIELARDLDPLFALGLEPPPPAPLAELRANDISAWFGDHLVLDRVSLTMPAGVITSLIGPSGCGKSTFLRILNRMHELIPSASLAGEVLLDGEDIYDAERRLVDARKSIGMVFQKPNPFPAMSIYDNVIAGLKLTGTRADRDRRDYLVESSLTKAGLWKEVRDRLRSPGGGLSGGQQQRLCIARSLAVAPRVLLMDEPCSALDPTSTRVIEETMLELAKEVTIVIVTHNMQQAQRVSSQCAFFLAAQGKPGGIVEHGDTEAMFGDPVDPRTFDYVNGRFG